MTTSAFYMATRQRDNFLNRFHSTSKKYMLKSINAIQFIRCCLNDKLMTTEASTIKTLEVNTQSIIMNNEV